MRPNAVVSAAAQRLDHEPVPRGQSRKGAAGTETVWKVTETLRKVYLLA